jgi:hypothetical protein
VHIRAIVSDSNTADRSSRTKIDRHLGMNGIVLGPVIAAMFIVVWDILATSNRRKSTSVDEG